MKPEALEFGRDDPAAVLARMAQLAERRRGWINLEPVVDDDTAVPLCTWSAGGQRRRLGRRAQATPPVVGVQHHVGRKVADTAAVPAGWIVVQDHGRRGLVVRVPEEEPNERVLAWLLDAGGTLCPVAITGWAAQVFAVVG